MFVIFLLTIYFKYLREDASIKFMSLLEKINPETQSDVTKLIRDQTKYEQNYIYFPNKKYYDSEF